MKSLKDGAPETTPEADRSRVLSEACIRNAAEKALAEKCCPEEGISCCCDAAAEAFEGFFPGCKCPECPSAEQCRAAFAEAKLPEEVDFSNVVIEPLFEEFVDFDTFAKSDFRAVKVKDCAAVPKSKKLLKFTLDDGTGTDRTILSGIHAFYEPEELIGKTLIAITNLSPRKMMGIDSCGMLLSALNKRGEEEELNLLMVDGKIPAGAKLY